LVLWGCSHFSVQFCGGHLRSATHLETEPVVFMLQTQHEGWWQL
jgi:hypothetical protein